MKKRYSTPEMEVEAFNIFTVFTDSSTGGGGIDQGGENVGDDPGAKGTGVFFLGQPCLDNTASMRRVIFSAGHGLQLLSAVSFVNRKTSPQIPKEKTAKSTGLFFNVHKFLMV